MVGGIHPAVTIGAHAHERCREERLQPLAHAHRTGSRSAAAVRGGEGLVEVDVDHIESHVARQHLPEDRVQVRAVVVEQAAGVVNDLLHFSDAPLEHAQRGRVGEHDAGGARSDELAKRANIQVAVGRRREFADGAAAHYRRGGIGAVGGIRDQDLGSLGVAAVKVVGADHRHAGELTLGAGHGRQRERPHARDPAQHLLQLVHAG